MANLYDDRWEYSIKQELIHNTQIAIVRYALQVQATPEGDRGANFANRSAFALQVLQNPGNAMTLSSPDHQREN